MKLLPAIKRTSGQALLIVLLGMAVVLTMVLSIVARSVTDIQLTSKDDESLRAFSAAEAGVENAIIVGTDTGDVNLTNDSGYSALVSGLAENEVEYYLPDEYYPGESGTVWFVSHDANGDLSCTSLPCVYASNVTMDTCWGVEGMDENDTNAPAVELSVYYDYNATTGNTPLGATPNFGDVRVARTTYDPQPARITANDFNLASSAGCEVDDNNMEFSASVVLGSGGLNIPCVNSAGCLLFAKVKFLYNNEVQPLGVKLQSGTTFPAQGTFIESVGTSGESTRKIEVFRTYREPLSIFESAIFSMGTNADLEK